MKNLQEVYPGVKEDSPATIVDTQRENNAAESGEQRAQDDIEKQRPDSGDSDVVSTMQQPLAAPKATPQTSKNSTILESLEEETAATQRVTESAGDHRGSDFKELLDYYEKGLGGKREGGLEEKPPLEGVTTSNSTTIDNASKESSGVPTVDDVGPPRSSTRTPPPSPSPEIKSSSDGTTKEGGGGGGGLLSSLVGTKIVPMVAPLVTPLVSVVTVVGEGTAAVLVGRGDQADTAADETTVTKGLDRTTATTESVVEPTTRTEEAPILGRVEQQLESQVVGLDTDQGGIAKTAAHKEPVEGATQEELKQRESREEPAVPATLPTPIITEPNERTMTAIETKAPKEEDDGVPVELEAQDETVVETVLVPKPTPAVIQEGEQGSVVAPQQKQQQQIPDKKEKKKHFQKLRAAVLCLFKLKSES